MAIDAAVDVDAGGVDVEGLHEAQHHGGEGLVDLEEVEVARSSMPLSRRIFSVTGTGPVSMIVGSVPILAVALIRARGFRSWRDAEVAVADQHRGGAVDDAGGVAGVVDVVDPLEVRVLQDRHGVEAGHGLADVLERRLERAEGLHVGRGPHVLVAVEDRQAVDVAHRHDRLREAVVRPGGGGALLALDGEEVAVVAGEAELGGDDVGADALRHEVGLDRERRGRRRSRRRRSPSGTRLIISTPPAM